MAISGPVNTPGSSGFSTSGTGTSLTIACTGSTSGNQLYAFVAWASSSGATASPSSGWTAIASGSNSSIYVTVYSRTATGSDSLTVTFSASLQRAALAAYEMSGSGFGVSAFNTGNQAPGPSATPPVASQCFSIYAFAGTFATPGVAGVSTNPTVGTYDGNVSGGTASSYTISLAFSHLASTSGSASKITWSSSPGFESNAQIILAPLVATTSQTKTSAVTAKLKASASAVFLATSTVSANALAISKALSTASSTLAAALNARVSASQGATSNVTARSIASILALLAAPSTATGRISASVRSRAAAVSSVSGRNSLTHYLRSAATSALSGARGMRTYVTTKATSTLSPLVRIAITLSTRATSVATAARQVVLVVSARATSIVSPARGILALTRSTATSTVSARMRAAATATAKATSTVSARVVAAVRLAKAATSTVSAGFRAAVMSRAASATSVISARAKSVVTVTRSATSAANAVRAGLTIRATLHATSTVHAAAGVVQAITRSATSTVTAVRGSFFVRILTRATSAVKAVFVNTSDTIGQDEVCYAIEDALLRLISQAMQPGGKLAAVSQYAPVAIVEHVVPPEQRIFPNIAVQFRRLDVTPSGIHREDVTATYDISVAVQQPYTAGNPATIGNARAILSPYVDDGAGNGVIEILRANPTLGGLCRRSKVVALEEATLQTVSATGGAIVAAFIVLECEYTVTVA